ncbi:ankyrin repeat-containing protein ITN1-like [Salvia divinorum]|uniref:Ankyrin repeat-containing protein ITN1-like n=1 Tax=Salvia divinorum TaxID=28513 RepID=A0ABD1HAJ5_SALDI
MDDNSDDGSIAEEVEKIYDALTKGDAATLRQLCEHDPFAIGAVLLMKASSLNVGPSEAIFLYEAIVRGHTTLFVEEVLKLDPLLPQVRDSRQSCLLHVAAAEGRVDICQSLLLVAPNTGWWRDCDDMNPLHIAAIKGHVDIVQLLFQMYPFLVHNLEEGVVDAMDDDGQTIMDLAVRSNQSESIQFLVESKRRTCKTRRILSLCCVLVIKKSRHYNVVIKNYLSCNVVDDDDYYSGTQPWAAASMPFVYFLG